LHTGVSGTMDRNDDRILGKTEYEVRLNLSILSPPNCFKIIELILKLDIVLKSQLEAGCFNFRSLIFLVLVLWEELCS